MKYKKTIPFILLALIINFNAFCNEITKTPFILGDTLSFQSSILGQKREINVYLPEGYKHNGEQTYPVIYLLDGSKEEDFIHIAGLVQFGSFSSLKMLPKSIVVGIANIDRKHDYTPQSTHPLDIRDLPTHGGSAKFIQFIGKELQPLVNKTYRSNQENTLIGQSLGGLLATEILLKHPQLFSRYIIISPSMWFNDAKLLNNPVSPTHSPKAVYVAVGKEGKVMEEGAKQVYNKLKKELPTSSQVNFTYFEQLDYNETLHLAVYDAFKQFYMEQ
ncbi:alpha/beta hydrolase [Pseudoalteromonas sp. NEC-BIFX-2020_002]|uniref:alpha/beta hydrolase n=1 Tax=Pseudoalteromonas TaxID=53246 RepID=UPI0007DAEAC9|nr:MULTISPECIES: alpha/beta hydrolase-fold protein [Pseudoalteromonas]NMR27374.1 alpha/beta hydrolase [Pseudoalteromonas sp. NEC-BIFX-2020_015]NNG44717.1 alpha/beta hydrolase [Pseudoalteromonas sp. NEC-BIFX-2020_002]